MQRQPLRPLDAWERNVLHSLRPMFPQLTEDVISQSVCHPANKSPPFDEYTLLQHCIDDLLELRTFTENEKNLNNNNYYTGDGGHGFGATATFAVVNQEAMFGRSGSKLAPAPSLDFPTVAKSPQQNSAQKRQTHIGNPLKQMPDLVVSRPTSHGRTAAAAATAQTASATAAATAVAATIVSGQSTESTAKTLTSTDLSKCQTSEVDQIFEQLLDDLPELKGYLDDLDPNSWADGGPDSLPDLPSGVPERLSPGGGREARCNAPATVSSSMVNTHSTGTVQMSSSYCTAVNAAKHRAGARAGRSRKRSRVDMDAVPGAGPSPTSSTRSGSPTASFCSYSDSSDSDVPPVRFLQTKSPTPLTRDGDGMRLHTDQHTKRRKMIKKANKAHQEPSKPALNGTDQGDVAMTTEPVPSTSSTATDPVANQDVNVKEPLSKRNDRHELDKTWSPSCSTVNFFDPSREYPGLGSHVDPQASGLLPQSAHPDTSSKLGPTVVHQHSLMPTGQVKSHATGAASSSFVQELPPATTSNSLGNDTGSSNVRSKSGFPSPPQIFKVPDLMGAIPSAPVHVHNVAGGLAPAASMRETVAPSNAVSYRSATGAPEIPANLAPPNKHIAQEIALIQNQLSTMSESLKSAGEALLMKPQEVQDRSSVILRSTSPQPSGKRRQRQVASHRSYVDVIDEVAEAFEEAFGPVAPVEFVDISTPTTASRTKSKEVHVIDNSPIVYDLADSQEGNGDIQIIETPVFEAPAASAAKKDANRPPKVTRPGPIPNLAQAAGLEEQNPLPLPQPHKGPPAVEVGHENSQVQAPVAPVVTAPVAAANPRELILDEQTETVCLMFEDADPVDIRQRLRFTLHPEPIQYVCNYLLENPGYPRKTDRPKAAATATVAAPLPDKSTPHVGSCVTSVAPADTMPLSAPPSKDYLQSYDEMPSRDYLTQAMFLLQNEFRRVSVADIRHITSVFRFHYAPTRWCLMEGLKKAGFDTSENIDRSDSTQALPSATISFSRGEQPLVDIPIKADRLSCPYDKVRAIKVLKCGRQKRGIGFVLVPELRQEVEYILQLNKAASEEKDKVLAETLNNTTYELEGQTIECGCCYGAFSFEAMIQCLEGHLFCQQCLEHYAEESVYGQGKSRLQCMSDGCEANYPRSQLERAIKATVLAKFEERQQEEALNLADMEDLVRCPFCDFAALMDKGDKVFNCQNTKCAKASCRNCKEPWAGHFAIPCKEMEKKDETSLRVAFEEKMTKAKIRTCHRCKASFTKSDGCNKMTCRCGAKMCYICRLPDINYNHFCNHPRDPGHGCTKCKVCSLWTNPDEDDERAIREIQKEAQVSRKAKGFTDERLIGAPEEVSAQKEKQAKTSH